MMQLSSWASVRPFMASSCTSHTAYSSAVRVESVAARNCRIHEVPSWTAKRVLVLPCSMASSIASLSEEDVAGGDPPKGARWRSKPQGAVHGLIRQAHGAGLAETVGALGPGLGDGGKALPVPDAAPVLEPLDEHRQR